MSHLKSRPAGKIVLEMAFLTVHESDDKLIDFKFSLITGLLYLLEIKA